MSNTSLPPEVLEPIRAVFFQECDELLASLDLGLNTLKLGNADPETINMVFRAVHSIKGGAANFDLVRLAHFSHGFEAVLSELRAGVLAPGQALLGDLLVASDVLSDLLEEARGGPAASSDRAERCSSVLASHIGLRPGAALPREVMGAGTALSSDKGPILQEQDCQTWRIHFRPGASLYYSANDPIPIFRELNRLGDVDLKIDDRDLPELPDLQPEMAYLAWTALLKTSQPEQAIWNVFEFVSGDCELEIAAHMPLPNSANGSPKPVGSEAGTDQPAQGAKRAIRVDLDRVDKLFNLVGELVVEQTMFRQFITSHPNPEAQSAYAEFGRLSQEIQESLLAIRSQSVKPVFQRMARLIRQLESATGKSVSFTTEGEDAEVDRSVLEQLADPLTHMIRNAVDHGLEAPEERTRLGKSSTGSVRMSAYHRFGRIVLEIADDGRGIDRERVYQTALARGIVAPKTTLTEQEIDSLILSPGFSTSETVSEISGRGVGMDVVNKSVRALGGRISINSQKGKGTTFVLSLPLTLALLDGMIVRTGEGRFVVPVVSIIESLQLRPEDVKAIGDAKVLRYREQYIPLVDLAGILGYRGTAPSSYPVCIVVEDDLSGRVAIIVEEIYGRQQIVVKNIQGAYRPGDGVSAATVLGDGQIALILDINGIVERQNPRSPISQHLVA